jgi:hypothetical protein
VNRRLSVVSRQHSRAATTRGRARARTALVQRRVRVSLGDFATLVTVRFADPASESSCRVRAKDSQRWSRQRVLVAARSPLPIAIWSSETSAVVPVRPSRPWRAEYGTQMVELVAPRVGYAVSMNIRSIARVTVAALGLSLSLAACGDDDDDEIGDVAVLECTGTCTCDSDTRSCSCAGGTECVIEGEGNVTFTCDGNASCGLGCGENCDIICPGTTGCVAESGSGATFECQGTASCEFTCEADCSVSCGGAASCLVRCADADTCDLSECRGSTDCGDGVFACGRACP